MFKLQIDDQELEKEVHNLIIGKIKHVLRNDEKIQELIEECYESEIKRKVNMTFAFQDLRDRITSQGLFQIQELRDQFMKDFKKTEGYKAALEKANSETLKMLFKNEV